METMTLPAGSLKRLHVNRHFIAMNRSRPAGQKLPQYTVKDRGKVWYARSVEIHGSSTMVDASDKPLACGARAYMETKGEMVLIDPMTFADAKALGGDAVQPEACPLATTGGKS